MKKNKSLKLKLEKILERKNGDFQTFEENLETELQCFNPTFNSSFDPNELGESEREDVSKLFLKLGQLQMEKENPQFQDSFEVAEKLCPDQFFVFYSQGKAYLKHPHDLHYLNAAKKSFLRAIELHPDYFGACYNLGIVYLHQGLNLEEPHLFQEAIEQFSKAEALMKENAGEKPSFFYWQFGRAWYYLGKLSGEAMDFHYAKEKYKLATALEQQSPFFWNDYGDTLTELAFLIGNRDYFFESIHLYQKAVEIEPRGYQGHFNLACAYQCIFELTTDFDYFEKANDSFKIAEKLQAHLGLKKAALFLKWGQLLATAGKLKREIILLETSLEKFVEADKLEPNHPGILSRFGEAEMLIGANTDEINFLRRAEQKLVRSLALNEELPEIWYLYGTCLNELGRYFMDESFYRQGIEKFQHGLSLNQSDPLLWYGLAMSHFAIGDLLNDKEMIEKASRYCSQVLEFGGQGFLQFWNDWAVMLMRLSEMTLDEHYIESALEKFEYILKEEGNFSLDNFYLRGEEKEFFDFREVGKENIQKEQSDREQIDLEWLYNYGCALDMHGDFTDDSKSYEQAVQVLSDVVRLDPHYLHARYNLALALSHLGESVADVDCLQKASEHFDYLVGENPEDETAYNDWGLTLLHLGDLLKDDYRPELSQEIFLKAEKKFFHALSLGSLPAFYNLACLYSMMGNFSAAIHYLERAEASDTLPPLDDMMHDEWLEGIRKTEGFKTFIAALSKKQGKKE